MRKNSDVAKILYEIADLLEIQNVQWKPQAYRKAAQTVESLSEDISVVAKEGHLAELPGIGEHIAKKIEEIVKTGKLAYLEKLKKEIPLDVESLFQIEGLGPKKIKLLYQKLKIRTVEDLKDAATEGKLRKLRGMGEKTEQHILQSIERVQKRGPARILLGFAVPLAEEMVEALKTVKGIQEVTVAGSYRRGKETLGDIDILIASSNPKITMGAFIKLSGVAAVLAHGETKASIRLENGVQVDARVVEKNQYGSALQYFTGSKEHSVALRKIALRKGLTLSEYGLSTLKGKKVIASKTEEEVYHKLGMQYIPPEMRENRGEIELAVKKKIPKLVAWNDINGDFQTQTTWSDGVHSIEEMARRAEEIDWKFMTVTDHVGGIGITHPLDEKRLEKQSIEIDKLNKKLDLHIFKGAEIDVTKSGALALSKNACKQLDVVLASVHSAFRMSSAEMTKRLCAAFQDYPVHIFGHPTARLINKRDGILFDVEKVFETAKERGVFLEINGQPARMDLSDVHVHTAREMGCSFVISSDAHSKEQLEYLRYGVLTARRGWLEKKHVLNTRSVQEIEKALKK